MLKLNMRAYNDSLHPFIFEDQPHCPTPIRGNLVHLNQTFTLAMQHQTLPSVLKIALGELMAASALLAATLKMEGALVLQLQSQGALKLLVVECSQDKYLNLSMRATVKWDNAQTIAVENYKFIDLVQHGQFVITLDPSVGEAYQGIVPIEGETIAHMLQNYMLRSQQIETSLWLHCDGKVASGLLLQKLPHIANKTLPETDSDAWNRVNILADTVSDDELKKLAPELLLSRLFSEENVRLFTPKNIQFKCSCSKFKVGNMLRLLGAIEVESILAELGKIEVNCDFCNKYYVFDAVDAAQILANDVILTVNKSKH